MESMIFETRTISMAILMMIWVKEKTTARILASETTDQHVRLLDSHKGYPLSLPFVSAVVVLPTRDSSSE